MRTREILRPVVAVTASVAVALGAVGCGKESFPEGPARAESMVEYGENLAKLSPSEKYVAQFLTRTEIRRPKDRGGSTDADWVTTIGSGCLDNSAYDTNGGQLEIRYSTWGWRIASSTISIKSSDPTSIAIPKWSPDEPDIIRIQAGQPGPEDDLKFEGVIINGDDLGDPEKVRSGQYLKPADNITAEALQTFPCKLEGEIVKVEAFNEYGYPQEIK